MGAEESKSVGSSSSPSFASAAVEFPNTCRRESEAVAWTLLHQVTLDKWKEGHAEAANFAETTLSCDGVLHKDCSASFCINRQGILNISKSAAIFSFRKRSKFYKMAEHFEYNHIPAQMSAINNFRVKSVLCFRDKLVILHLQRNQCTQFGVLDLRVNKFKGLFGKKNRLYDNEILAGAISYDYNKCLVRFANPQNANVNFVTNLTRANHSLELYDLNTDSLIRRIDLRTFPTHFAFDPRFQWKRIAVTNFEPRHDNCLSIVNLESWEVLQTNLNINDVNNTLYPYMKDLQYTRDGSLIIVTIIDNTCFCREKRTRNYRPIGCTVFILDGDNATMLRCIKYQRFTCTLHLCPTNYTPVFSLCGSRMAFVVNQPDQPTYNFVQIYKLPQVINVQNMCRVVIRQNFPTDLLTELPLPLKLINYLYFKPEY